jgi:hypothetical protein
MVLKDATSGNCHEQLYSIWHAYSMWMNGGWGECGSAFRAGPDVFGQFFDFLGLFQHGK